MKKKINVEDSVGTVLAYDLTKIVPGEFKGAAFRKGHIIKEEDIAQLKSMGKYHIYVIELGEEEVHENEAGNIIATMATGEGLYITEPYEGKVSIKSEIKGLLKINKEGLQELNDIEMVIMATLHNNTPVEKDGPVAGTRIIPLTIERNKLKKLKEIEEKYGKIINVKPYKKLKCGIVVTGTEVYEGLIKDKFGSVLKNKVEDLDGEVIEIRYSPDNKDQIKENINYFLEKNADMVLVSGGMSVDADDVTPVAIRETVDEVITYGSPVLPGAMFMIGYEKETPVLGIPACGMYSKITVLDLVLPRLFTKEKLSRRDITMMGHGGLCLGCAVCTYPICHLGK